MNSSRVHRRRNLLNGTSVLVSPQRTERPWQGQLETPEEPVLATHDPECYLCPGNRRAGGHENPDYTGGWAFDNDFPALVAGGSEAGELTRHPLLQASEESGRCRVVCYSPRHDLALASMSGSEARGALDCLFDEFARLDADPDIGYVQMFENRGAMMGCSNPHPHAQVWATRQIPDEPAREQAHQASYYVAHGSTLLMDYLHEELRQGERLVCQNDHAVALVPFWAVWPFELLLLPRRQVSGPGELQAPEVAGLAACLQTALRALNGLFDTPMPYSMGFHARPSDGDPHPEWQFHAHIFPPLLRSATVRKHMVGFELLGMPQRDLTPELAAERLRLALAKNLDKS